MSAAESSDSSDAEGIEVDVDPNMQMFSSSDSVFRSKSPPPPQQPAAQRQSSPSALAQSSSAATAPTSSSSAVSSASKATTTSQPPLLSPLLYQTPQGMMYAAPSNGGVIFSLAQGDPNSAHPQFITIPLSMVATNGQGELDLSKRK